jgi:hypothetical protein
LPSAANPLSQILSPRAAKADGCGDLLHAAHHPSINATIKLVKEGSFPLLWVLTFHAWMLTSKTTSSQIFPKEVPCMILMLYFQKASSPAAFYHAIFLFSWRSWQGEKVARSDLDMQPCFCMCSNSRARNTTI